MVNGSSGYGGQGGTSVPYSSEYRKPEWEVPTDQLILTSAARFGERVGPIADSDSGQNLPIPIVFGTAKISVVQIERFAPSSLPLSEWSETAFYDIGAIVEGSDGTTWYCWKAGPGGSERPHGSGPLFLTSGSNAKWALISNTSSTTYPLWAPGAIYRKYDRVWAGPLTGSQKTNELYEAIEGGVSGVYGPTGKGDSIEDGSVVWKWIGSWPQPCFLHAIILAIAEGHLDRISKIWLGKELLELESSFGGYLTRGIFFDRGEGIGTLPNPFFDSYSKTAKLYGLSVETGTEKEFPPVAVEVSSDPDVIDLNPAEIIARLLDGEHNDGRTAISWGGTYEPDKTSSGYSTYCDAYELALSYVIKSEVSVLEVIRDILAITNADAILSGDLLKIVPLEDRAEGDFVPANTALYDLGPDDFLEPLRISTRPAEDVRSAFPISYVDRSAEYAEVTIEGEDFAARIGGTTSTKRASSLSTGAILPDGKIAVRQSRIFAQRSAKVRHEFTIRLPSRFLLLEPTDIVTLTDPAIGLNLYPVRIVRVEESENGIEIVAEDYPGGASHATAYVPQIGDGYAPRAATTIASLPGTLNGTTLSVEPHFLSEEDFSWANWTPGPLPNGGFNTRGPHDYGEEAKVPPACWTPVAFLVGNNDEISPCLGLWNAGLSLKKTEARYGGVSLAFDDPIWTPPNGTLRLFGVKSVRLPIRVTAENQYRWQGRLDAKCTSVHGSQYQIFSFIVRLYDAAGEYIDERYEEKEIAVGNSWQELIFSLDSNGWEWNLPFPEDARFADVYLLAYAPGFIPDDRILIDDVWLGLREIVSPEMNFVTTDESTQIAYGKKIFRQTRVNALATNDSFDDIFSVLSNETTARLRVTSDGDVVFPLGATSQGTFFTTGAQGLLAVKRDDPNNMLQLVPSALSSGGIQWWLTTSQYRANWPIPIGGIEQLGNFFFWNETNARIEAAISANTGRLFSRALSGADNVLVGSSGWIINSGYTVSDFELVSRKDANSGYIGRSSTGNFVLPSTTSSASWIGGLSFQSYTDANNAWIGANYFYNGSGFRRKYAGYAFALYFLNGDVYFRVANFDNANSEITDGGTTALKVSCADGSIVIPSLASADVIGADSNGKLINVSSQIENSTVSAALGNSDEINLEIDWEQITPAIMIGPGTYLLNFQARVKNSAGSGAEKIYLRVVDDLGAILFPYIFVVIESIGESPAFEKFLNFSKVITLTSTREIALEAKIESEPTYLSVVGTYGGGLPTTWISATFLAPN